VITFLALLLACGDDPKMVVVDDAVDESEQAVPEQELPILSVAHPPRGSFQGTGSGVVSGKVERGSADVLNVMVNGENRHTDTGAVLLANSEVRRSFLGG